jgi:hypothetical protein
MWGLWWAKRYWGRFSPSTWVSLADHHSTNFSINIITRGWHNRPISGGSVPLYQFKKKLFLLNVRLTTSEKLEPVSIFNLLLF